MKHSFFIAIAALLLMASCKKETLSDKGVSEKWDITSAQTGTTYTMTVFYPDKEFPKTPVPVVYVLDGFWWSDMAAGVLTDYSRSGKIPKCLMVSLDYKKGDGVYARSTDLIYPGPGITNGATKTPEAPKFYDFLQQELLPQVEAKYAADTTLRILFGHSLGGAFVLYATLSHAQHPLFTKCIAASSSIGLGSDNYIFSLEDSVAKQVSDLPVSLYLGVGTYVGSATVMHEELYRRLKNRHYPSLKIGFGTSNYEHGPDAYPAFQQGIQFIFNN
ncbi:MAG: alpha/beta hydrolase-fold protein [Chitinophagales bacterium]